MERGFECPIRFNVIFQQVLTLRKVYRLEYDVRISAKRSRIPKLIPLQLV